MSKVRDILGPDRDSEFLQSFVRVGIKADDEDDVPYKSVYQKQKPNELPKQLSEGKSDTTATTPTKSRGPQFGGSDKKTTKKKKKPKEYFDEIYTDKDRAAAVSSGHYDIKQSLNIKRRLDRTEALQIPDDSDPGTLYELGLREYKSGNLETAVLFISKALELNPSDQNALIARSKCYLLLGDPAKGLEDAETALLADQTNIRAVLQKAESLYFLGQFEHSLMFFHRGLRLRPELNSFRLGVQKSQEAIEKTIGGFPKKTNTNNNGKSNGELPATQSQSQNRTQSSQQESNKTINRNRQITSASSGGIASTPKSQSSVKLPQTSTTVSAVALAAVAAAAAATTTTAAAASTQSIKSLPSPVAVVRRPKSTKADRDKREARKLLGELCVDKEYLENLLKHPDLKRADTGAENISILAKDAVQFLNNRQEFWRQQRPCTAIPKHAANKKSSNDSPYPAWF